MEGSGILMEGTLCSLRVKTQGFLSVPSGSLCVLGDGHHSASYRENGPRPVFEGELLELRPHCSLYCLLSAQKNCQKHRVTRDNITQVPT